MTWKDGGNYGRLSREIVSEDGGRAVCRVWTKQNAEHRGEGIDGSGTEPCPQGEANFRLILQAPQILEALEMVWSIRESAAYEERNEAGVTGYVFYLTENQCAQIKAVLAAVK